MVTRRSNFFDVVLSYFCLAVPRLHWQRVGPHSGSKIACLFPMRAYAARCRTPAVYLFGSIALALAEGRPTFWVQKSVLVLNRGLRRAMYCVCIMLWCDVVSFCVCCGVVCGVVLLCSTCYVAFLCMLVCCVVVVLLLSFYESYCLLLCC